MTEPMTPLDRRAQRREERRLQNREDLLDAAEKVFGEYGVHEGSIRRITEESGFSPAAVYVFFDNKQHLLAKTITRRSDELIQILRDSSEWSLTPLDKLLNFIDLGIAFFEKYPNFRLLLRHIRGGPTVTGSMLGTYAMEVQERNVDSIRLLAKIIRDGQKSDRLSEGNSYDIARLYVFLINEFLLLDEGRVAPAVSGLTVNQFRKLVGAMLQGNQSRPTT